MAEDESSRCSTSCSEGETHLISSGANGFNRDEEDLEKENFQRILNAFLFYRSHSLKRVQRAEQQYRDLPAHHQEMLPCYMDHIDLVRTCIDHNYQVIKLITAQTSGMFENKDHGPVQSGENVIRGVPPTGFDMDKVKTTLKQFSRDWSDAGKAERSACYDPVIAEICQRFPVHKCDPSTVYVLVPGAGLGRLAFELAKQGYCCQGNEWSLFMLFGSNFVLNKCREVNAFTLYPWVHSWINLRSFSHQIEAVTFPDVNPADLPASANFSMAAGDFLDVYTEPESWHCVATVFFIDTAHNIISYIETIWKILKPGGYWVNMGPLLYHFAEVPNEHSIELSYEEVRSIILKFGFEFEKEELSVKSTYTQNVHSMLTYQYNSVFFVVRKPL
ncbi:carnosine N-methyltransferase-like [Liolophura sinensis]|uniref:carnosine N-methyltransferase-like n=2 Tax=Liolophura sinensis TaxID=3198878 RepID=UPI0031590241